MGQYWAIGALLLGCVLMGNACKYTCVPKELCEYEAPDFEYRRKRDCPEHQICCGVPRGNKPEQPSGPPSSYGSGYQHQPSYDQTIQTGVGSTGQKHRPAVPVSVAPNGPNDNLSGGNNYDQTRRYPQVNGGYPEGHSQGQWPAGQRPAGNGGYGAATQPKGHDDQPTGPAGNNLNLGRNDFSGGNGNNFNQPDRNPVVNPEGTTQGQRPAGQWPAGGYGAATQPKGREDQPTGGYTGGNGNSWNQPDKNPAIYGGHQANVPASVKPEGTTQGQWPAGQRPSGNGGYGQPKGREDQPTGGYTGGNGNNWNQAAGNPPVNGGYPANVPGQWPAGQRPAGGYGAATLPKGREDQPTGGYTGGNGNSWNQPDKNPAVHGGHQANVPASVKPEGTTQGQWPAGQRPAGNGGYGAGNLPTGTAGNNLNPGRREQPTQGYNANKATPGTEGARPGQNQHCGMSNVNGLGFIKGITGDQARPGQYPWVVAVFSNGKYLCGGSLISSDYVLTVAHPLVVKTETDLVVRAGEWNMDTNEESFQIENREVERIKRHEGFNFTSGANNLAILKLKTPFQLKEHIRTICMPVPKKTFEPRRCIVAGWGKMKYQSSDYSAVLKKVDLPLVDRHTCEQQLRKTKVGQDFQLPASMICAGGELNQDACTGDGGSALFCPIGEDDSGLYEQVGIVNWGIECGLKDVPATYTDVAQFKHWIEEQTLPFRYRKSGRPLY
ncbi:pro-resilin-like [Drosophila elegans]|uniref:pro-resilin-like n=1 Tax=Drosophila elegans TaxID=30023 RepID=UPI0007E89A36|nr:pro-resilin-like [Drosophila elegans]